MTSLKSSTRHCPKRAISKYKEVFELIIINHGNKIHIDKIVLSSENEALLLCSKKNVISVNHSYVKVKTNIYELNTKRLTCILEILEHSKRNP